jgi:hypothetical protein
MNFPQKNLPFLDASSQSFFVLFAIGDIPDRCESLQTDSWKNSRKPKIDFRAALARSLIGKSYWESRCDQRAYKQGACFPPRRRTR